jgi:hypothetical protein
VKDVPNSAGLFSPRWSPDGRYLLAGTADSKKLVLYNFTTDNWEDLVTQQWGFPSWTQDAKCVYFLNADDALLPVYKICLADRKLLHVTDLTRAGDLVAGRFGYWTGLGPDDSILALRDISLQELYALETKFP